MDLEWAQDKSWVKILLTNAKTAEPGEVQELYLHRQDSLLDPVSTLEQWYALRPRKPSEEIFTILVDGRARRLGKQEMINELRSIWNEKRPKKSQLLHGHSFRIGGASLRWNLGASREDIKRCGRWQSDAYSIYLRRFSDAELENTRRLLIDLKGRSPRKIEERHKEIEERR